MIFSSVQHKRRYSEDPIHWKYIYFETVFTRKLLANSTNNFKEITINLKLYVLLKQNFRVDFYCVDVKKNMMQHKGD